MGWRVVSISSRAKLELKMNYLIVRTNDIVRIFIDEISVLMIENTAVSLTCTLIEALIKNKILVLFCDNKRLPFAMMRSLHGSCDSSLKIDKQIKWNENIKKEVWTSLVREKIRKQAQVFQNTNKSIYNQLMEFRDQVELADATNREGFAAKVYFNELFGHNFGRRDECFINSALDYGYAIILAAVSREIYSNGYISEIGLFHSNQFNNTNLSSDLMEVFRPLVDIKVKTFESEAYELTSEYKYELVSILNDSVLCGGRMLTVLNAIQYFVKGVFNALDKENLGLLNFYEF